MTNSDIGKWASEVCPRKAEKDEEPEEEEELYCNRCEERQMFKKVKDGWQCEVCGHIVADEYEAEENEDNDTEETPPFF